MPKGTRVSRCVDKVKKSKDEGAAIAICQASTKQGYATGKTLKEALATKFGSKGSKFSRTSSRHATNPGESKAEAREDAKKFTKKHGQQASQTHKQTGKIPGPKPGEKNEQVEAYRDLAYQLHEALPALLAPLAAGAKVAGAAIGKGVAAVGKGVVKAGGSAARAGGRMVKKKAINMAKDKAAEAGAEGVATGGDTAKKRAELGQQADSDKDLEENKMNNAYLNKLMESYGARKMTPDEREGARRLAGHGRDKPGEEGKPVSPKTGTRASKKTQAAAARAEKEEADANNAAARGSTMKDHTEYHRIGALMAEAMGLIEAHQAYVDKKSKDDLKAGKADAGFAGPIARGTAGSRDRVVVAGKKRAGETIERRVPGSDASKVSDENKAQVELNRRKKEAKEKKLGLPGGPLDKQTDKALSDREKELRAGDQ